MPDVLERPRSKPARDAPAGDSRSSGPKRGPHKTQRERDLDTLADVIAADAGPLEPAEAAALVDMLAELDALHCAAGLVDDLEPSDRELIGLELAVAVALFVRVGAPRCFLPWRTRRPWGAMAPAIIAARIRGHARPLRIASPALASLGRILLPDDLHDINPRRPKELDA